MKRKKITGGKTLGEALAVQSSGQARMRPPCWGMRCLSGSGQAVAGQGSADLWCVQRPHAPRAPSALAWCYPSSSP